METAVRKQSWYHFNCQTHGMRNHSASSVKKKGRWGRKRLNDWQNIMENKEGEEKFRCRWNRNLKERKENLLTQNAKYFMSLPYATKHTHKKKGKSKEKKELPLETVILQRQRRPTEFKKNLNSVLQRHPFNGHFALWSSRLCPDPAPWRNGKVKSQHKRNGLSKNTTYNALH